MFYHSEISLPFHLVQTYEPTLLNIWNTQNLVIETLESTNHHHVFQRDAIRPVNMILILKHELK